MYFHIYAKLAYFAGRNMFSFLHYVAPSSSLTKSMPVINGVGMIKSNCGTNCAYATCAKTVVLYKYQ